MKYLQLLIVLFLSFLFCFSQKKFTLPDFDKKINLIAVKGIEENFEITDTIINSYLRVKTFNKAKVLISEIIYSDTNRKELVGDYKKYFSNGKLKVTAYYNVEGKLDGKLKTFFDNGKIKREDNYKNGLLVAGKCFDSQGKEINYSPYEISPMQDLDEFNKCLVYPKILRKNNIEGELIFKLFIDTLGQITEVNYNSKDNQEFVDAAMKCIDKMKFIPTYIDGEAQSFVIFVPVNFRLR